MKNSMANNIKLLGSSWIDSFEHLLSVANEQIFIVSPYIRFHPGIEKLISVIKKFNNTSVVRVNIVTDFSVHSIATGATDPQALVQLVNAIPNTKVTCLPKLHAKVYIADKKLAIVTSGNLTAGGLVSNFEYGVKFEKKEVIERLFTDMESFEESGLPLSHNDLKKLTSLQCKLKSSSYQDFQLAEQDLESILHKNKKLRTQTLQQKFAPPILYLLKEYGSMTTKQLYKKIYEYFPEVCDNRGLKRSYIVWQRDLRNSLKGLVNKNAVRLVPTEGFERRGHYHLVSKSSFNKA